MSHLKRQISIQQATRAKVMQLLDITELQYGSLVMDAAFAYLQLHLGDNPAKTELEQTGLFWKWWRNHWHDVDMEFVTEVKHMTTAERREWYTIVHNPETFQYTPQKSIMMDACKTVKPLIKHTL
jgi:hypothetical protein